MVAQSLSWRNAAYVSSSWLVFTGEQGVLYQFLSFLTPWSPISFRLVAFPFQEVASLGYPLLQLRHHVPLATLKSLHPTAVPGGAGGFLRSLRVPVGRGCCAGTALRVAAWRIYEPAARPRC